MCVCVCVCVSLSVCTSLCVRLCQLIRIAYFPLPSSPPLASQSPAPSLTHLGQELSHIVVAALYHHLILDTPGGTFVTQARYIALLCTHMTFHLKIKVWTYWPPWGATDLNGYNCECVARPSRRKRQLRKIDHLTGQQLTRGVRGRRWGRTVRVRTRRITLL